LFVQSSLPIKKQSLNSRHSAVVDRQQSVGYELYVDVVSKTDRLPTCATDSGAKEKRDWKYYWFFMFIFYL